jgi:excisionase family DNA binding protein
MFRGDLVRNDTKLPSIPHTQTAMMGQHGEVTAREAALALGLSERTIRRAIARGELIATKQGRAFRIAADELTRYRAGLGRLQRRDALPSTVHFPEPVSPFVLPASPHQNSTRLQNLPVPLSRFVGRDREVQAISALLRQEDARLVTLTGPGGVGKTRLALRVADIVADTVPDGVVFVPLAAIDHADLVLPAIAHRFGLREAAHRSLLDSLMETISDRRVLLVLDNFEHVLAAASSVADLLMRCPHLSVLVTSREPLRVNGEQRLPVFPLALPNAHETPEPDQLATFEAITLFVDRARQVLPDFTLDAGNAAAVLAMCRRLDGLPLAIELAAAWLRILSPIALSARLERRFSLLTGGAPNQPTRLRTMRDAIAWSHDLLSDDDRRCLRRLAVFAGGFTFEAAESIMRAHRAVECSSRREADEGGDLADTGDTLPLLAALLDKSLLYVEQGEGRESRFLMLETVREFALEQLEASGEAPVTRGGHADYYVELAEAAASDAGGAGDGAWMRRLTVERSNLRAAQDWLEQTDQAGTLLQMTGALWHYWYRLGDLSEGRLRLERALTATPDVEPRFRARALRGAGVLAWQSGDYDRSRERLEAALVAYRALDDRTGIAWALNSLGCLCATLSAEDRAETLFHESLEIFRELGDAIGTANLTSNLGELAERTGRPELAITRLEAGLAMWRALGDRVGAIRAMVFLGQAFLEQHELERAAVVLTGALAAIRDIDYRQILPAAMRALAQLAARRGDDLGAARCFGAAEGAMTSLGMELPAARRASHDRAVADLRERLGLGAFTAAWAEGRDDPDRLAAALTARTREADAEPGTNETQSDELGGFTSRQREVLRLMALGRTDREIAHALFISRTTASKHVAAILTKLGVDTRTAAVAIAVRNGLV